MSRVSCVALCCLFLAAAPATAQLKAPNKRPKLESGADTNDANAYYRFGLEQIRRDPGAAADAFYWAARINPGWAEALYARRVALLIDQPRRLEKYLQGDQRTHQSKDVRQIDTLYYRALTQNPFLYEKLDRVMIDAMIKKWAEDYVGPGNSGASEVEYYLQSGLPQSGPELRAQLAYDDGRFGEALKLWADAMKRSKYKSYYHIWRGKLFYQMGNVDSSYAEFTQALDELHTRDKKDIVYLYESKALLEQAIGMIHERHDSLTAAREAYGRALQEDLSYYPAHLRLGYLALTLKDTATALNEMDMAVQVRGDEPMLRYAYGYTLLVAHKYPEAEAQLRKAIELEPLFAMPRAVLGQLLEEQHKPQDALRAYQDYMTYAAFSEPRRAEVKARIAALSSGNTSGAPQ
jgi:tetratricopeptide repeat protein